MDNQILLYLLNMAGSELKNMMIDLMTVSILMVFSIIILILMIEYFVIFLITLYKSGQLKIEWRRHK